MNIISVIYTVLSKIKTKYTKSRKNISVGNKTVIEYGSKIYVSETGQLAIGNHCYIKSNPQWHHTGLPFNASICCGRNATISIGNQTRTAAHITAHKNVCIGDGCLIAGGVNIMDSNGILMSSKERANWHEDEPKEIIIGDNVWICINSTILKGTKIGNNCVVSANSVVKGIFPDNVLIQGNPAVIVKHLMIE